jgi:uncharacterized protein YunC (DUF1805 family)
VVQVKPIIVDQQMYVGVHISLPKTNLIAIAADYGYIMCGALDIRLLNEQLANRQIVAGRAIGVRSFEDLLLAPLESTTTEANKWGIVPGMTGAQALKKMTRSNTAT